MKKISVIAAVALAAIMSSCGNGTPKADLKTDVDTLSYAFGMSQTQGLKEYLVQREGVDTTYINEFIKGLNEGANAGDDKKKTAYYAGLRIGQMISQQWVKGINYEVFGEDSTQTISLKNLLAGFVAGTLEKGGLMSVEEATSTRESMMQSIKAKQMEKLYGENKKACQEFMKKIAKKDGVKSLGDGIYYEVLTEGTGEIPADTNVVKVNYEGKLINDTVFDSSYQRGEPTTFRCNQVIPGWKTALTHMPVGSTWMVYIPQEQAYASGEAGKIKPFSCLIFKIELVGIEK
ncbi:MAG: FKBP-type peptidyl-prolyl cis-trans isomerase [Bacteroidaceae bacterium]|nr:FKBP-type peptidyl-prolyl cis-trans isomerase [Bacteroidaceae bacterium]MBO4841280.1 FKBP-type peptidyl-prolyl cis-trans isomerase [Bacteroidaceae bacterium]